jgi:hypothetical protein
MMPAFRARLSVALWAGVLVFSCAQMVGQTDPNERAFPQSKASIEKALKSLQATMSGRLPVVDGFAKPGERPLDRYQRAFYQATAEVTSVPSGGSMVRITAKITAWYADPVASRSGYQLLASNGRIEADILDQLQTQLAATSPASTTPAPQPAAAAIDTAPSAPTPARSFPEAKNTLPSALSRSLADARPGKGEKPATESSPKKANPLQAEADSLEEILKNTAHPKNLVAVKKSGTPVVATPSLSAKPEFLAAEHDEFELLDFNPDWVHVRISGLSRGWIWRNSVEMPEGIPDTATHAAFGVAAAGDRFHVVREEIAAFPGDWAPLRSKSVKIISVQKVDDKKEAGPQDRLAYTKYLLEKSMPEVAKKPDELNGVVVIFDSADGGMIAATAPALQEWKVGKLSDAALWHKCFFDPPETFDSATPTSSGSGAAAQR